MLETHIFFSELVHLVQKKMCKPKRNLFHVGGIKVASLVLVCTLDPEEQCDHVLLAGFPRDGEEQDWSDDSQHPVCLECARHPLL